MTGNGWAVLPILVFVLPVAAQERVAPQQSRGGKALGEPWDGVPDEVRKLLPAEWPLPKDLDQWQKTDHAKTREVVLRCLGTLPPRPASLQVKVLSREERGDHVLERFQFHNGVDSLVGGILLIPKERKGPVPAIIGLHGHGGSKETICTDEKNPQCVGPMLVKKGYVVAAIDTYFCGDRARKDAKGTDEGTLFKLNLWLGRSLWGMMLRDQQCLIDYLQTRPEVAKDKIGVTGMSMGGTGSWWLAAVDDRIQALVGVAGFTRYTELIAHNSPRLHGVYYYVPGILAHFDTEAIYALIAPRPMLMLSGDRDAGLPLDGIEVLEKKLGQVYRLHGKGEHFKSIVYANTAHEYLPEMREAMAAWLEKHLPKGL
jgi:dienelactone hydrolase